MKLLAVGFEASILLTSCYSYTSVVGSGVQGIKEVSQWNHYVIAGLALVGVSDSRHMAEDAENYTIFTRHSFVNGLRAAITFGIYTPTNTTVTK